jgi:hypothetical protein
VGEGPGQKDNNRGPSKRGEIRRIRVQHRRERGAGEDCDHRVQTRVARDGVSAGAWVSTSQKNDDRADDLMPWAEHFARWVRQGQARPEPRLGPAGFLSDTERSLR